MRIIGAWIIWCVWGVAALAQELVWIQIEAQPSLRAAEDRLRGYAAQLADVAGFQQSSNWYVIALGPYAENEAQDRLRSLRALGDIPSDSFIARPSAYRSQFWPIGANDLAATVPVPAPTQAEETPEASQEASQTNTSIAEPLETPDETVAQARASERLLTRDEKKDLQIALQWAGFYQAAIDGSYGRGTRAAMAAWQGAKGFETTGVLTTRQRAALLRDYNAVLDGMGIARITDTPAGISAELPMGVVAFDTYEPPFAHYRATGDVAAHISLISQPGSEARFRGLYSVLQTLDMVPPDGPRTLGRSFFEIEGIDAERHTTIEVSYARGEMKGFMFVWPAGDDQRRTRVLDELRASFETLPGVLDPDLVEPSEDQAIDLLAGLEIRSPASTATGFFVDAAGTVLTHDQAVASCDRLSISGGSTDMQVAGVDAGLGVAVLRPETAIAPLGYGTFQTAVPRLKSDIVVAGFSFGGVLGAPTLTKGTLEDLRGLAGEQEVKRLSVTVQPGDAGGPVLDPSGGILGLLQPQGATAQQLPADVNFATDTDALRAFMDQNGVAMSETEGGAAIGVPALQRLAADIAVLVECWD